MHVVDRAGHAVSRIARSRRKNWRISGHKRPERIAVALGDAGDQVRSPGQRQRSRKTNEDRGDVPLERTASTPHRSGLCRDPGRARTESLSFESEHNPRAIAREAQGLAEELPNAAKAYSDLPNGERSAF